MATRAALPQLRFFAAAAILLWASQVMAEGNLDNFSGLQEGAAPARAGPRDPWGPVPIAGVSIANVAPGLLTFFNNAPVFGLPGTVVGDFWDSTQVTGDWDGRRTELVRRGLFVDLYTTSTYQNVTSGGIKTGDSFVQNTQLSVNVDTARAGLWSGGLFHFTVQSRYGSSFDDAFNAGTFVPVYTGLVHPGPMFENQTLPTEYFLVQSITKELSVVAGKISDVFLPDQTLFGNSYKFYFANFNLNKNPMTTNFYNPVAWAAPLLVWAPNKNFVLAGGVLDTHTQADNFATHAFDSQNYFLTSIINYSVAGLPGQFLPSYNWSNKPLIDFRMPFGTLSPSQVIPAIGALLGGPTAGLPVQLDKDSWFLIGNISQYLYVRDDTTAIANKLKTGQPLNGIGVFARFGYAPPETNRITRDFSVALFEHGLASSRPYDSFGVGYFYNNFSGDLKQSLSELSLGSVKLRNESGLEVFYDFAVTPAIRLIPSYQHIWEPFFAETQTQRQSADIFLARLTVVW